MTAQTTAQMTAQMAARMAAQMAAYVVDGRPRHNAGVVSQRTNWATEPRGIATVAPLDECGAARRRGGEAARRGRTKAARVQDGTEMEESSYGVQRTSRRSCTTRRPHVTPHREQITKRRQKTHNHPCPGFLLGPDFCAGPLDRRRSYLVRLAIPSPGRLVSAIVRPPPNAPSVRTAIAVARSPSRRRLRDLSSRRRLVVVVSSSRLVPSTPSPPLLVSPTAASRHRDIAASRHRGIAASRHRGIAASRHRPSTHRPHVRVRAALSSVANLATVTLVDSDLLSLDHDDYDLLCGRLSFADAEGPLDTAMMAQPVPHPTTDRKRVKVYELRNNDWFDRGTGFCSSSFVADEDGELRTPRIVVESEDEPERLLLDIRPRRRDNFSKQQDTLIVWTGPSGMDMALSFQEADGCHLIWSFINNAQGSVAAAGDDALSDDMAVDVATTISLPPAELGNLQDIENNMRVISATSPGRDALARFIVQEEYITKLIPLVDMAEDLESLVELHHLCNIFKIILLLNDNAIIEYAIQDEILPGVVGALEYDPDFPSHKANHRAWLSNEDRFKEVVHIQDDSIRRRIHHTYRLQYLKDVVLARLLDDPTYSVLNSLIYFNQVDIVQYLQTNSAFLQDLFGIFMDPAEPLLRKKQGVMFIQQCCTIGKTLQPAIRVVLFSNFLAHGLFHVIHFGLRSPDVSVRVAATDILISIIDHDPQLMRQTIYRQMHDNAPQLTDILIDLLHAEVDVGIKSQICDALKVLLDPVPIQIAVPTDAAAAAVASAAVHAKDLPTARRLQEDPIQERFLRYFYEHLAVRLFQPLLDLETRPDLEFSILDEGIFAYLNELACFFVRNHGSLCRSFVIQHNIALRFVQLLSCRVKHLQLIGVRFLRMIVSVRDATYAQHIMDKRLFDPLLDLLQSCMPRDNLVASACLELFDCFTKEEPTDLTKHLVSTYRPKLQALASLPTFRDLLAGRVTRPCLPVNIFGASQMDQQRQQQLVDMAAMCDDDDDDDDDDDGDLPPSSRNGGHAPLLHSMAMDSDEYWNGDDDEEDLHTAFGSRGNVGDAGDAGDDVGRAVSPKQLVDYASDDDDIDDDANADADDANDSDRSSEPDAAKTATTAVGAFSVEFASALAPADDPPLAVNDSDDTSNNNSSSQSNGIARVDPSTPSASSPSLGHGLAGTPPMRLSEKRRREEEDDDDAFAKMAVHNKRRNSRAAVFNAETTVTPSKTGAPPHANGTSNGTSNGTNKGVANGLSNATSNGLTNGSGTSNGNGNGNDVEADSGAAPVPSTPIKKISINLTSSTLQAVSADALAGDDAA